MKKIAVCFLFITICAIPFLGLAKVVIDTPQTGGLYAANEKPKMISNQFSFTEGASVDKKGNVFFTDQPNNRIWEYDINGKLSLWMENTGRSNGTYFDSKGNLIS